MATVYKHFAPEEAQFLASAFPQFVKNLGTNFPVAALAFDTTSVEAAFFTLVATNYSSGNLTLDVYWYADSASTGDVVWGCQIAAITPNTDSQDVETDSLATAQTVTDSHIGTTGQRVHSCSITISNLDSLTDGDVVWLRVYRDVADGADTMAGDALITHLRLSYSDGG